MKRSSLSTPALRSPAERRSKSRGESKGNQLGSVDSIGRIKAGPPGYGLHSSDSQSRVPKRTPRLSPRGSLSGLYRQPSAKESEARGYHSWESEARRRAPASQAFGEASSADMENVAQLRDNLRPAVVLPAASQAVGSSQASPVSREPYEAGGYESVEYAQYPRTMGSSSSLSGATTHTESGELVLLRLRAANALQQAHDSRIMKLIGRRSVLCGASVYSDSAVGRRSERDQRQPRSSQTRGGGPSSPSSPPKMSARDRHPGHSLGSLMPPGPNSSRSQLNFEVPKPLGEANRKLPEGDTDGSFDGGEQSASPSAEAKAFEPETHDTVSSGGNALASGVGALPGIQQSVSVELQQEADGLPSGGSVLPEATTAKNLLESFSASAPSGYPVEDDCQGLLGGDFSEVPTFGLSASDPAATLGQQGTTLAASDEAFIQDLRKQNFEADGAALEEQQGEALGSDTCAAMTMPPGASQVDDALPPAAEGAIIWPGRQVASHDEVSVGQGMLPSAAPPGEDLPAGMTPEQAQQAMQFGGIQWPSALLQNEAGSLVAPQTWRFVVPPQQASNPASPASGAPLSPEANGPSAEEDQATPVIRLLRDESGEQAPPAQPLDSNEKRQLLAELVDCLTARTQKAEKDLGNEQRAKRALNVTVEVQQRQIIRLQQQLEFVAQGWPYANLMAQGGEPPPGASLPVDATGAAPVHTAMRPRTLDA